MELKKKYAVCMWGQLRAVNTVINNFNEYLLKPLDSDLFVMAQTTETSIDGNINLLKTTKKILYTPSPNITTLFKCHNKLLNSANYLNIPYLNVYENWYKIKEMYGDDFEKNYEYIILTRSDFLHLFNFPDILNLTYDKNQLHQLSINRYDNIL